MIKYNRQNTEALTAGVRAQVLSLVRVLRHAEHLNRVDICMTVGSPMMDEIRKVRGNNRIQAGCNMPKTQTALEPLKELSRVKEPKVDGAVTLEYSAMLERHMKGDGL